VLLSPRPGKVWKIIEPSLSRDLSPDQIRREPGYLDTVESIWQNLKDYVE
jgi:NitT/TauT family transport system ATP-binding protein